MWNLHTYIACKSCTTITIWVQKKELKRERERERERERVGGMVVLCVKIIITQQNLQLLGDIHNPNERPNKKPAAKKTLENT
jgi:hypothetical protein